MAKRCDVASGNSDADWRKLISKTGRFWPLEECDRGKAAEDKIRSDEIDENEAALTEATEMALVIRSLKCKLCPIEMTVGEEVPTKVIEKGNTLSSWE